MDGIRRSKALFWVASSRKDMRSLPGDVQDVFGFALHQAQSGSKHVQAKPLRGFSGAGILEVVEDYNGDTYRAVYTVSFASAVYVLHCFQKKTCTGIKTASHHIELIKTRLKQGEAHARGEQRG